MDRTKQHLPEWIREGIITPDQGKQIGDWLDARRGTGPSILTVLAGIGALMTGVGIILIVAHNWDQMGHAARILFALLPGLAGTALAVFSALRKPDSFAWTEASGILQFFGLGSSISLISQVYQITGSMDAYLLTWLALALPTMFMLRSMATAALFIIMASWFVIITGMGFFGGETPLHYLWMLAAWAVFIFTLKQRKHEGWFAFHGWLIALSLAAAVPALGRHTQKSELITLCYPVLMAIYLWADEFYRTRFGLIKPGGLNMAGRLGLLILCIVLSYRTFWKEVVREEMMLELRFPGPWLFWLPLSAAAALTAFLIFRYVNSGKIPKPEVIVGLLLTACMPVFGLLSYTTGAVLVNLMILALGFWYIRRGIAWVRLDILNYGLLWLAAFVVCRFFDFNLGYLFRGLFFIALGLLLFGINYYLLRQKKEVKP